MEVCVKWLRVLIYKILFPLFIPAIVPTCSTSSIPFIHSFLFWFCPVQKWLSFVCFFSLSCHSDPPTVEPVHMEVRQGLGRPVVMTCRVLRAHPSRVLQYEWFFSNRLLNAGAFEPHKDESEYIIRSLNREGWGEYTCNVINEAGAGKCTFQVTGKEAMSFKIYSLFFFTFLTDLTNCSVCPSTLCFSSFYTDRGESITHQFSFHSGLIKHF